MSIHQKIFAYIFSMILVLFIIVSVAVYFLFYRTFYENEVRNIVNNQDNVTENIRFLLSQIEGVSTMFAANSNIANELISIEAESQYTPSQNGVQLHHVNTLENTANVLEIVSAIHLISTQGNVFTSNAALDTSQVDRLKQLYKKQTENPSEEYTGLQFITLSTGYTFSAISYLRPVYDYPSQGSFSLLVIDINYVMLREVLTAAAINNHEWVLLADREGKTIFTFPYNTILDPIVSENPILLTSSKSILTKKVFGRDMIVASSDIATPYWSMIRLIPLSDIRENINQIEGNIVLLIILYLLIALFSSYYISKILIRPIRELYEKFRIVERGDLSARIITRRKDEFGHLGHSFNAMVSQIDMLLKEQLDEQQKKNSLEFEILQAQINPHFLYNTLDSIKWLAAMQNVNNIGELTTSLINLLKYNITVKTPIVLLGDEIRSLHNYIVVQKYRYGDTFQTRFDLDPSTIDCEVLHFMLQPIVENAIIHGFEDIEHTGVITVTSKIRGDMLYIHVHDNGVGIEQEKLENFETNSSGKFNGIGIMNIHNRIQLQYGKQYGLTISSEKNRGSTVEIKLPFRPKTFNEVKND